MTIIQLQQLVDDYFQANERALPWRVLDSSGALDSYHVLVSELMLQQTQARRVVPNYQQFLREFPTVADLAAAPLASVLTAWSGLGYNRRAKFLHQTAQILVEAFEGTAPDSIDELRALPGIGVNTAAAIYVYSFNKPAVFVETNVRSVFIHHFFADRTDVADSDVLKLVAKSLTLPVVARDPRRWYWSLMDYGVYIKTEYGNASRRSKHHTRQAAFEGSRRQARGAVIKQLTEGAAGRATLLRATKDYPGFEAVLDDLIREGLVEQKNGRFQLAEGDILSR